VYRPSRFAAIVTLQPGSYTAVIEGQGKTTCVWLVEIYNPQLITHGSAASDGGRYNGRRNKNARRRIAAGRAIC